MSAPAPASPMFWRFNPEIYRLVGMKCKDCGHITYPRRNICPACGSLNLEERKLSRKGTVQTYAINWVLPPGLEPPVPLIIVDLEGGGRYQGVITEVTKPEEVKIGGKVEMVLRKVFTDRGINIYGYKFRVAEES